MTDPIHRKRNQADTPGDRIGKLEGKMDTQSVIHEYYARRVDQHETMIRELQRFMWICLGATAIISILVPLLIKRL